MMYTEQQLCEFGNYLFRTYDVQVFSNDGKNQPIFQRQVADADMANWEYETKSPTNETYYPSQFKIGDEVMLSIHQTYGANPYPLKANVLAVHFYESKVKYDLEIPIENESPTRMYNIDSCFVLSRS